MNDDLPVSEVAQLDMNPVTNHDSITLIKQEDGNWRGFAWKNGKLVQARQADPGLVMQLLITHE